MFFYLFPDFTQFQPKNHEKHPKSIQIRDLISNHQHLVMYRWRLDGGGNIDANPLFVDAGGDDDTPGTDDDNVRLQAASPCIDAGDNSVVTEASDLDGNARVVDGDCDSIATVDMGAYEFGWVYLGDFDGQCDVDLGDFAIMSAAWLSDDTPTANWNQDCDLDNSGVIYIGDLEMLGANWLAGK